MSTMSPLPGSFAGVMSPPIAGLAPMGQLVRRLALGTPISADELRSLLGPDAEVQLSRIPFRIERDEQNRVIGAGLTLRPTTHQFVLEGRTLYTWCALDTLIFPRVLGRSAEVRSTCPVTGANIALSVTPDTVASVSPNDAVMSVVPLVASDDMRRSFCAEVHFLASPEAARQWQSGRSEAHVVSIAEGLAFAHQFAESFLGDAAMQKESSSCCTR